MNELNRKIKQNKNEINNKKNKNNTTKEKPNRPPHTTLWNQNKYDMGVWKKHKFSPKNNLDNNQYPILMVDKVPIKPIHSNEIITSTNSSISSLTKHSIPNPTKKINNKVDTFLQSWKNKLKETKSNTVNINSIDEFPTIKQSQISNSNNEDTSKSSKQKDKGETLSSTSSNSSRITSYTIDEKTIEANKQILKEEEIQNNNITVRKNKRTRSHKNHIRTKNDTLSNNNKIFLSVDKTTNYQRTPVKVKSKIVIPSNQQMLQKFGFKGKATISKQKYSSEPK